MKKKDMVKILVAYWHYYSNLINLENMAYYGIKWNCKHEFIIWNGILRRNKMH